LEQTSRLSLVLAIMKQIIQSTKPSAAKQLVLMEFW
jgi:hypothetical protein